MILLVDDDQNRFSDVAKRVGAGNIFWATDADEAISFLEGSIEFDVIMLDYNLREKETGLKVAIHIAANASLFQDSAIVIHSASASGVADMVKVLRECGIEPEVDGQAYFRIELNDREYSLYDPFLETRVILCKTNAWH